MEQPRGPVFDAVVRANYQLGRRMGKALHVKAKEMDGRLAWGLGDGLGRNGVPSDRRVREWMAEMPDFPETMIWSGIINEIHILPWLRPYLTSGDSTARLEQRNPSRRLRLLPRFGILVRPGRAAKGGLAAGAG